MIHYNMRYRGAYEYDKFVLNILQYHNEMLDYLKDLETDNDIINLKYLCNEVDDLYNSYNLSNGLCESIYNTLMLFNK